MSDVWGLKMFEKKLEHPASSLALARLLPLKEDIWCNMFDRKMDDDTHGSWALLSVALRATTARSFF